MSSQRISRWQSYSGILFIPCGIVIAAVLLFLSEMYMVPILIPLSFLVALAALLLAAPAIARLCAGLYRLIFRTGVKYELMAASLEKRAYSIGISVVLLTAISSCASLTTGLIQTGLGEIPETSGYWKAQISTAEVSHGVSREQATDFVKDKGVVLGEARILLSASETTNVFIGSCVDYAAYSNDDPQCPKETDMAPETLYVPADSNNSYADAQLFFPDIDDTKKYDLSTVHVQKVPGLTETILSTHNQEILAQGLLFVLDETQFSLTQFLEFLSHTEVGITDQEHIDYTLFMMKHSYAALGKILVIVLMVFASSVVVAIAVCAALRRRKLVESLELRGVKPSIAKGILRLECVGLTLPFACGGIAVGSIFAMLIAQASSMNYRDVNLLFSLGECFVLVIMVLVATELVLRFSERAVSKGDQELITSAVSS
ncbi:hypothetical protein EML15_08125 [Corynebacterium sp. sy017]|uniref:hypothetical protein n=1 Tax=unclassified Corynebacterium TaxID=2624378 RepID=UPI001186B21F|nr:MULTISPECIES: hypothetical protein [unclassified Corynebacterium]MBP3089110.1 hypothetical protein [Corynebacterium sp. sy017]TSD91424.1 hypothetical protein ELY17_08135 [Corynebacterium sp. SY003]